MSFIITNFEQLKGKLVNKRGRKINPKYDDLNETIGEKKGFDIISVGSLLEAAGVDIDKDRLFQF